MGCFEGKWASKITQLFSSQANYNNQKSQEINGNYDR
jgi:hypothetical protein